MRHDTSQDSVKLLYKCGCKANYQGPLALTQISVATSPAGTGIGCLIRSTSNKSASVNWRARFFKRDARLEAFRNSAATCFLLVRSSCCSAFRRRIATFKPSAALAASATSGAS